MPFNRRPSFAPLALATFSVAAPLSFASVASAEGKVIGVDVVAALPSDGTVAGVDTGWGAGIRVGNQWDVPLLNLMPELKFQYTNFGGPVDMTAWNLGLGGAIGISFILKPSVFAHGGVGHYGYNAPAGLESSQTAFGYDVGAALGLSLVAFDLGAQVAWNGIVGDSSIDKLQWVSVGGYTSFTLPGG
jgi:hypothetical protein